MKITKTVGEQCGTFAELYALFQIRLVSLKISFFASYSDSLVFASVSLLQPTLQSVNAVLSGSITDSIFSFNFFTPLNVLIFNFAYNRSLSTKMTDDRRKRPTTEELVMHHNSSV